MNKGEHDCGSALILLLKDKEQLPMKRCKELVFLSDLKSSFQASVGCKQQVLLTVIHHLTQIIHNSKT